MKRITAVAAVLLTIHAAPARPSPAVDVYGVANVSLDYVNDNDRRPGYEGSGPALSSNQSNLGFYATDGIGAGWTAAARVEGGVSVDTGHIFSGAATSLRDTYAALIGRYGEFRAGHYSSFYKTATEPLDPFKDTIADAQAVIGNVNGNVLFSEWYNNEVGWRAPAYHGFRGGLDIIVNQGNDNLPLQSSSNLYTNNAKAMGLSLGVDWRRDWLNAGLDYERRGNYAYQQDVSAVKLYAGAALLNRRAHVAAVFENADSVLGTAPANASTASRNAFYVSGSFRVRPADTVSAAFGVLGSEGSISGSGATWLAFGADHAFSKTAAVYLLYTIMMNGSAAAYGLGQFQDTFTSTPPGEGAVPGQTGQNVSAFSLGIRISFGDDGRAGT